MKEFEALEQFVKLQLDKRANEDSLFAKSYAKDNKSLEECIKYIVGEQYAQVKDGKGNCRCTGMADNDIVSLAIHYYDEDDVKPNHDFLVKIGDKSVKVEMPKPQPKKDDFGALFKGASDNVVPFVPSQKAQEQPKKQEKKADVQQLSLFDF